MKNYLFSLLAGLVVGVIYSLIGVQSPAPPIFALIGLLGIYIGESTASYTKVEIQKIKNKYETKEISNKK